MSAPLELKKTKLLAEIASRIDAVGGAESRELAKTFAETFCAEIDVEDFASRDAATWAAIALSHFKFGA